MFYFMFCNLLQSLQNLQKHLNISNTTFYLFELYLNVNVSNTEHQTLSNIPCREGFSFYLPFSRASGYMLKAVDTT